MDFEPCFKVHNLSMFTLKASNLVKWPLLKHDLSRGGCQFNDWLKFEIPSTISELLMYLFGVFDTILCDGQTRYKLQEMYGKSV